MFEINKGQDNNSNICRHFHCSIFSLDEIGRPPSTKIMRFAIHPSFMEAETAKPDFLEVISRSVGLSSSFYYFKLQVTQTNSFSVPQECYYRKDGDAMAAPVKISLSYILQSVFLSRTQHFVCIYWCCSSHKALELPYV